MNPLIFSQSLEEIDNQLRKINETNYIVNIYDYQKILNIVKSIILCLHLETPSLGEHKVVGINKE